MEFMNQTDQIILNGYLGLNKINKLSMYLVVTIGIESLLILSYVKLAF